MIAQASVHLETVVQILDPPMHMALGMMKVEATRAKSSIFMRFLALMPVGYHLIDGDQL